MNQILLKMSKDILDSARMKLPDLKVELALLLYAQHRLSIGKARELADMSLWEFRQLLGSRRIPAHYDVSDFEQDITTLKQMGRL